MAKYRKIESHIWRDAKFRSLDEGTQLLFFYLLTNPNLSMAGTLDMTIGMLSESLGKGRETVSKRFQNLLDNDMVEYDSVGLIWLKNFLRYNEPANSNMAKGICSAIEDLPECELLISIITSTTSYCSRFIEETHFDGYLKRLCKQFRNGSETVSKHIQNPVTETVTETETEKGATSVASRSVVSKKNLSVPNPDGVEPDQWARYLKLRRDKHLPLTVEAFALLEREAKKSGLTTPQAIQLCLEHSWAGFKAEWMKKESATSTDTGAGVPAFGKMSVKQACFFGSKLAEIVKDGVPRKFRDGAQSWMEVGQRIADALIDSEEDYKVLAELLVKNKIVKIKDRK